MFTGIVEEAGLVERLEPAADSLQISVRSSVCARGTKLGDSIAVNGCCLTVVKIKVRGRHKLLQFDLLKETWRLTNLQFARAGSRVRSPGPGPDAWPVHSALPGPVVPAGGADARGLM